MEQYIFSAEQRAAMEGMLIPFAIYQYIDQRSIPLIISDGLRRLLGFENLQTAYRDLSHVGYMLAHPDDMARITESVFRFEEEGGDYEVIYRTRTITSDAYRIIHAFGSHREMPNGVRLSYVWYADEGVYTEEIRTEGIPLNQALNNALHEESVLKAGKYDHMTGLPNMSYFFELMKAGKSRILSDGDRPLILYMNLVGMKYYNHKYSFAEGDELLRAFSKLLADTFGNESCCHIAQDHFAVYTREHGLEDTLDAFLQNCRHLSEKEALPVHIGIYPDTEELPGSKACDRAKFACEALRTTYGSGYHYYSDTLRDDIQRRQYIQANIDRAIAENWIQVYYQPIIRAANGKVCNDEALSRWVDPEKGVLPPNEFIPYLEESGQIYKLDLYVIEQVLVKIKSIKELGYQVVPNSINLSRSDFDACDIVEEIRARVDAAGLDRGMIAVEITESLIGSDFERMKEQIERFKALGFQVWLDDFGSGYSSLDALQSIRFDLVKFDMSFMQRLDSSESSRIVLTELTKLAASLGAETLCEGVETAKQVQFLQEIGCSKLQGFFYCKPLPFQMVVERRSNPKIGYENPEEVAYYEAIGKVNLYNLDLIGNEEDSLQDFFDTLPMGIIEIRGNATRFVRSNKSYREFVKRFLGFDLSREGTEFLPYDDDFVINVVQTCVELGIKTFYDQLLPNGATVHSFARRIAVNPVTNTTAVAIAVLSITYSNEIETYASIARALASDYYNIFVIDLDTNEYTEYSSRVGGEELSIIRHGEDFFESAKRDTMTRIYEEDREPFLALFTKETVLGDLDKQGVFTTTYRLIDSGRPMYVNMKITRMHGGNRIILGISIIDAQMKQLEEEKALKQAKVSLGRIAALAQNFNAIYVVKLETEQFVEYTSSAEYAQLGITKQGENFFTHVREDALSFIDPQDLDRHLRVMTKENILREIRSNGVFIHNYRLLMNDRSVPFSLRANLVEEDDGEKLVIGVKKVFSKDARTNESEIIFTHIAHALARGYTDLYYVDIDTDNFIEYHTDDNIGVLTEARRGSDFFEGCERDVKLFVHPEDQARFLRAMNREFLIETLNREKVYEFTYRKIENGRTFYVSMKVSRMEDDKRLIVLAVSDIDELTRQRREEERIQEERIVYARLHAITGNFIVVYVVDPATDDYREFSATDNYTESLAQAKEGRSFFDKVREAARQFNHPKDLQLFLSAFTKENVISEIERSGIFSLGYRLMMDGKPLHVQMKAAMVEEKEGPRLIVGLNDIDAQVRQEEEFGKRLARAQTQANIDALTGIKNKHAYLETEALMDRRISNHSQAPFAVVMLDVNDLKKINDTAGHQAGDEFLKSACRIICEVFKHSPVFRVGGDEFAVIPQGIDYDCIEELLGKVREHNVKASHDGGIVIAYGMARFDNDECVAAVFERADQNMYENKTALKSAHP